MLDDAHRLLDCMGAFINGCSNTHPAKDTAIENSPSSLEEVTTSLISSPRIEFSWYFISQRVHPTDRFKNDEA